MTAHNKETNSGEWSHIKRPEMTELEHHQLTVFIDALHDLYYAMKSKGLLLDGVTPPKSSC